MLTSMIFPNGMSAWVSVWRWVSVWQRHAGDTGFGAFPGARRNPTLALPAALHTRRRRLAPLGIAVELHA